MQNMKSLYQTTLVGLRYWEQAHGQVNANTPIVLALHWMTGDARSMHFLLDGYPNPLRYIALQGNYASGDPALGGYSWYPDDSAFYQRSETDQLPVIMQEEERIAVFVEQLKTLYPAKVAVVGMSQGGDLSLALSVYHPELFDLAIPCAGRLFPPTAPELYPKRHANLPMVHLMQGAADPIVPTSQAYQAAAWLRGAGFNTRLNIYGGVGHQMSKAMVKHIQKALLAL